MGKIAGKDVSLTVGGSAQPATDVVANLTSDEIDVTNIESADDWREFIAGFNSGEFTYNYFFDDSVVDPLATYLGAIVAFVLTIGAYSMSGNIKINNMELNTTIEDAVKWNVSARITGKPTEATT